MNKVFSINYEKVFTKKYKSQWFLSFLLYTMDMNLFRFYLHLTMVERYRKIDFVYRIL